MLKERYQRRNESIRADDTLIDRTLDALDASAAKARPRSVGFRLAVGFVCVLVLLVVAAARIIPPPKDIVAASNKTADTEDLLPLKSHSPDDLTLSVSGVTVINEHELSFILTVRGDKVDEQTNIGFTSDLFLRDGYSLSYSGIESTANERSYQFTIIHNAHPILEWLDERLNIEITLYTSGNRKQETKHTLDWSTISFDAPHSEQPLIDIGEGIAITGFSFSEDGQLIVHSRYPENTPDGTYCIPWFIRPNPHAEGKKYYTRESQETRASGYWYSSYTFDITRDELDGLQLMTTTEFAGDVITGSWPFTVDLTQLSTK